MFTFIWNLLINLPSLFKILKKTPDVIVVLKMIMDVVGSEQVQKILEAIRDALKKETLPDSLPTTEPERERIVTRLFKRLAFKTLNITEQQYTAMKNVYHENVFIA
jgi:hypothetical protein